MEHYFVLPVTYNGEVRNYNGRLVTFGYTYRFYIVVDGQEFVFEKDDEGQYRVFAERRNEDHKSGKEIDTILIQTIIIALTSLSTK